MNIKRKFKILSKKINSSSIVYFDNSATTPKPDVVVEEIVNFYNSSNSNVHRGINPLAEEATMKYEKARKIVAEFINAKSEKEIVFTSGATDGLNMVANIASRFCLGKGDVVVLSESEHHANIVPWLMLKKVYGFKIEYIPVSDKYRLDLGVAKKLLMNPRVKVLSIQHASNVLGIVHAIGEILRIAKKKNIVTIVDAAASVAHVKVDVARMGCDFLVFSGHKVFGPTGIGVVYGKERLLNTMDAWKGGGDMIREVRFDEYVLNELPYKFEAGTPNIVGAVGLGRALEFVSEIGFEKIGVYETDLVEYFIGKIVKVNFIKLIGPLGIQNRLPVFAFLIDGVHAHDVAYLLGEKGMITRAGNHCVQPLHDKLGLSATVRVSLSIYNTKKEIDMLLVELRRIYAMFN